MFEFRLLNRESLEKFIGSEEFTLLPNLPISRHRAVSHIHNPRCSSGDVLLILIFEENRLTGYLGILPDLLYLENREPVPFGWLSCLWVLPAARGRGVADQLIRKAAELWNDRLISADYVPATLGIYRKTPCFNEPVSVTGIRFYIRMNLAGLLPQRHPWLQSARGLFILIDRISNLVLDLRPRWKKINLAGSHPEYCEQLDQDTGDFMRQLQTGEWFRRGMDELNWILSFPWILNIPAKPADHTRYYFSAIDTSYISLAVRFRNERGQISGFLMISIRKGFMKIPISYVLPEAFEEVALYLHSLILKYKVSALTVFQHDWLSYFSRHPMPALYRKKFRRYYMISTPLLQLTQGRSFCIQDGDGDLAFT
jgi:GNAT superfamily N-acetyltransferase